VPEQFLHRADVVTGLKLMRGKAMSEHPFTGTDPFTGS
jgi:hypothetical protein